MKDVITITCYGKTETMERKKAIEFYKLCARSSDGAEKERYTNVLLDLIDGRNNAWDGVEPPKGMHVCKYCGGLANGTNEDVLCEDCKEVFGHSFWDEL